MVFDVASMRKDDLLRNGQSDTGTRRLRGLKQSKDVRARADPRSVIAYGHANPRSVDLVDADDDLTVASLHGFGRVLQEILEDAAQLVAELKNRGLV